MLPLPQLRREAFGTALIPMRVVSVHPSLFAAAAAIEDELSRQPGRVLAEPAHLTYSDWLGLLARAVNLPAPAKNDRLRLVLEDLLAVEAAADQGTAWDAGALLPLFLAMDLTAYGQRARPWPLTTSKGRALWRLFCEFGSRRRALGLTLEGDLWRAVSQVPLAGPLFKEDRCFHFVDLSEMPPLRFAGLQALAGQVELRFSFHWQPGGWFAALEALLARFEAQDLIGGEQLRFLPLPYAADPCLPALTGAEGETRLRLLRPTDRRQEIRHLSAALKAALQEGLAPAELAVVAPDLSAVQPFLRQALLEEGLPLSYSRSLPLLGAPSLAWLTPLARLLEGPPTRDDLLLLARSLAPYGLGPSLDDDPGLARAERYWRRHDVVILDAWREGAKTAPPTRPEEALEEACVARAYDPLAAFLAEWRQAETLGDWLARLAAALDALRLAPFRSADDARHFVYAYQAVKTLRAMVREWREGGFCDVSRPFAPGEFFAWLKRGADGALRLRTPFGPQQIAVLSPEDALCGSYRRLFVLDVVDGLWPAKKSGLAYLNDGERELLRHDLGAPLGPTERERWARQRQNLAALLLCAQSATLYAPMQIEGKELTVSPFLAHLVPAETLPTLPDRRALWSLRLERAWPQLRSRALCAAWPEQRRAEAERRLFKRDVEEGRRALALSRPEGEAARAYAAFLPPEWTSLVPEFVGQAHSHGLFESYAKCPFSAFAERFLGVREEPETSFDLGPKELGLAVHRCLEHLYTHSDWRLGRALEEVEEAAYRELLASFTRQLARKPRFSRLSLAPRARQWAVRIRRVVAAQAKRQEKAAPLFFEVDFGKEGQGFGSTLRVPQDGGEPFALLGRIDRIDLCPSPTGEGALALYDYKTSRNPDPYRAKLNAKHFGVDHFQLPIYLLALREHLAHTPELAASVRYLSAGFWLIGSPAEWPKEFTLDLADPAACAFFALDLATRRRMAAENAANLANRLAELLDAMSRGSFPASPTTCEHCSYLDLCRYWEAPAADTPTEAVS